MIERMHPGKSRFGLTVRIVVGSTLLRLAFALVVAAVVELQDASRASATSAEGVGTTFRVTLPLEAA
jgi:hypothetical protein